MACGAQRTMPIQTQTKRALPIWKGCFFKHNYQQMDGLFSVMPSIFNGIKIP